MSRHLWEIKHPYYCNEGLYFGTGLTGERVDDEFSTFTSFVEEYKDADFDYNLVFRWDWQEELFNGDIYYRNGKLKIFWMIQRKGFHRWSTIEVCRADEPAVIEFLKPRWGHMQKLWEGIS